MTNLWSKSDARLSYTQKKYNATKSKKLSHSLKVRVGWRGKKAAAFYGSSMCITVFRKAPPINATNITHSIIVGYSSINLIKIQKLEVFTYLFTYHLTQFINNENL